MASVVTTLTTACFYGLNRYDTHYGLCLWPPVVTALTTACVYGLQSLLHSLGLLLWPPVVTTLTRLVLWPPVMTLTRLNFMASSHYDTH